MKTNKTPVTFATKHSTGKAMEQWRCGVWETCQYAAKQCGEVEQKNEAGVQLVHQVVLRESASPAGSRSQICYALCICQIFSVD